VRNIGASVEVRALIGAAGMGVVGGDLTHRHTPAKSRHRQVLNGR